MSAKLIEIVLGLKRQGFVFTGNSSSLDSEVAKKLVEPLFKSEKGEDLASLIAGNVFIKKINREGIVVSIRYDPSSDITYFGCSTESPSHQTYEFFSRGQITLTPEEKIKIKGYKLIPYFEFLDVFVLHDAGPERYDDLQVERLLEGQHYPYLALCIANGKGEVVHTNLDVLEHLQLLYHRRKMFREFIQNGNGLLRDLQAKLNT